MVMVSQVWAFVKTYQIVHFNMCCLVYTNDVSLKVFLKENALVFHTDKTSQKMHSNCEQWLWASGVWLGMRGAKKKLCFLLSNISVLIDSVIRVMYFRFYKLISNFVV